MTESHPKPSNPRFIDLTGQTFGRLTVIDYVGKRTTPGGGRFHYWLCSCECGNQKIIDRRNLRSGVTVSCGCYNVEVVSKANRTHGLWQTRIYRIWKGMIQRCYNPKNTGYKHYGGRGITICQQWRIFEQFYLDMRHPPDNHFIERVDNNGPYSPDNCKWATRQEQVENRRNTKLFEYNGEQKTSPQWAKILGINKTTLYYRLNRGETIANALRK